MNNAIPKNISDKIANMGIICALLVVFYHVPSWCCDDCARFISDAFSHGVGKMAVPFFFMASGYLLAGHFEEDGWYRKAVVKRLRTLYLPMLLWCALFFIFAKFAFPVFCNLLSGRPVMEGTSITWHSLYASLPRLLAIHPFSTPYLGVLWFVRVLLILVLVSPLLKKVASPVVVLSLWIAHGIFAPDYDSPDIFEKTIFTLQRGWIPVFAATYFLPGIVLRMRDCSLDVPRKWGALALFAAIVLIIFRDCDICPIEPQYISWLAIPFLIVGVWSFCPGKRLPDFLIKAAFPVYVIHWFYKDIIVRFLAVKGFYPGSNALGYISIGLACFALSVGTAWLMRKLLPRTSAVLFGGR